MGMNGNTCEESVHNPIYIDLGWAYPPL